MRIFQIINILEHVIEEHFELSITRDSTILGDDGKDIFSKEYFSCNAPKMVLTVVHSYEDKTFKISLELPTSDGTVYASYITIFKYIEEVRRCDLERIIKDFCRNNSNYIKGE